MLSTLLITANDMAAAAISQLLEEAGVLRIVHRALPHMVGRPVFATIPNDYAAVHESILASRLAAADSPFAKGCQSLARLAIGLQPAEREASRFAFLRGFSLAS